VSDDEYRRTPFLAILAYVLGFLLFLAALAWAAVWLLRHLR
jgi:preprotein translocase subunit SecE